MNRNSNKSESSVRNIKTFDWWYRILYVVILICLLALVALSIWDTHQYNRPVVITLKADKINIKDTAYIAGVMQDVKDSIINKSISHTIEIDKSITEKTNLVFGIILAGITILLSIVVVIPKVLIKQEIEDQVVLATENINAKFHDTYKNKLAVHANTIDAHHARLITYLLLGKHFNTGSKQKDLLWTIGWGARSLKNYLRIFEQDNVLGEPLSMKNYGVFATDVCQYMSQASTALIESQRDVGPAPANYAESLFLGHYVSDKVPEVTKDNIYKMSFLLNDESGMNLIIRTIKEIFDLFYLIHEKSQEKNGIRTYMHIFQPLSHTSDIVFVLIVCLILSKKFPSTVLHTEWEIVARKIVSVSNYNKDEEYHDFVDRFVENCYNSLTGSPIDLDIVTIPSLFKMKFK